MPTQQLDVYREWLGITETERPLNHYQLLRLKTFEDDPVKVRERYRKMNAHVRKYATGDYAQQSQQLLNELAKAMLCLTDTGRKAEYDASLGRKDSASGPRRSFEELLILRKVVDPAQLNKARTYANTVGLEVRDAIVQQKLARPETVIPIYAEAVGLPYLDLSDITLDESLIERVPPYLARQHSCAPVMVDDGTVLMASPHPVLPEVEEELRLRIGMPVRSVLCTPAAINEVVARYYPKDVAAAETTSRSAAPQPAASAPVGGGSAPVATPEDRKRRMMVSLMAFNFAFMVAVVGQFAFRPAPALTVIGIGAVVGLVAAGAAFAALGLRR